MARTARRAPLDPSLARDSTLVRCLVTLGRGMRAAFGLSGRRVTVVGDGILEGSNE